eukprot:8902688-Pyramimonas_sp.AAC.1
MHVPGASITALLQKRCKTHKQPVTFRALHTQPKYSFAGLSRWVSRVLRRYLDTIPWIVRDARDAARRLRTRAFPRNMRWAKVDLKEFFMSGTAEELARD